MNKHKKHSGRMGRLFSMKAQAPSRKQTATTYTLELLESRVLLSADLAGAVQAVPMKPIEVPQQAVVLNVPTSPAVGQQTFSVSEMLAKPASSFLQSSTEPSPMTAQPNEDSAQKANTIPEILAQPSESNRQVAANLESLAQQTNLNSSTVPTQNPSISAPVMNTVQNDVASTPPVEQNRQALTVSDILVQQTKPFTQGPTEQNNVIPPPASPPQNNAGTPASSAIQLPLTSENSPQRTLSANQVSQEQNQAVSQTVVSSTLIPSAPINASVNIGSAPGAVVNPQLPQVSVDTSMPSTSLTVRVGPHGDYTDLQTALNNVSLGTTILLQPGVSYMSSNELGYILPNKTTGTGWIVIRPDVADSALPSPGTRITPADSAIMPKILRGDANSYAMSVAPGAHNYRIIGVEFMNQGNADTRLNGAFVNFDGRESSLSSQSNHLILDRVYIHGPSAPGSAGVKFGVVLGGQYQAVIDSTIEDLVSNDGEAKAIVGWGGAGPWLITNNFLSATGENMMIGGATPMISGVTPSDVEITHNHFYKPLTWRDDPAYTSGPNRVLTKNLLELKNAQRVLIEGNVFENVWPDGQFGYAILLTPLPGGVNSIDSAWTIVADITIKNNLFKNIADGLVLDGGGPTIHNPEGPTLPGGRFLIENNAFIGLGGDYSPTYFAGNLVQIQHGPFDVQIRHNTAAAYAGSTIRGSNFIFTYGIAGDDALLPLQRFVVQDNIFHAVNYPFVFGQEGTNLNTVAPGYIWTNNAIVGPWPTSGGWTVAMMPQGNGNDYPGSESNLGYTNLPGGDYRLSSSSPYKFAASDGKDIGVDWDRFTVANSRLG